MASLLAILSSAAKLWSWCSPTASPPSVEANRALSPNGVWTDAAVVAEPKDSRPRLPVVSPPVMMDEAEE